MSEETTPPPESGADELVAALAAAQGEFPTIEKKSTAVIPGRDGKQGYSYSYADLGDVLAAVRPVLSKHGLAITQYTEPGDGNRTALITELLHAAGGVRASKIELGQAPGNPQAFGGALTYHRRYQAVTLLGIAAEEDRDAQDVAPTTGGRDRERPPEIPSWARQATRERLAELTPLAEVLGPERAGQVVRTIRDSLGGMVPEVAIPILLLLHRNYRAALDELGYLDVVAREREGWEAQAAKDAADKANADAAAAAIEAADPNPPAGGEVDGAAGPVSAPDVDAADELPPDKPVAGSVEPPEFDAAAPPLEVEQAFRDAGCTCQDPGAGAMYDALVAADKPDQAAKVRGLVDDACPIRGHGIAF